MGYRSLDCLALILKFNRSFIILNVLWLLDSVDCKVIVVFLVVLLLRTKGAVVVGVLISVKILGLVFFLVLSQILWFPSLTSLAANLGNFDVIVLFFAHVVTLIW